jgi:hypothetical protein
MSGAAIKKMFSTRCSFDISCSDDNPTRTFASWKAEHALPAYRQPYTSFFEIRHRNQRHSARNGNITELVKYICACYWYNATIAFFLRFSHHTGQPLADLPTTTFPIWHRHNGAIATLWLVIDQFGGAPLV